MSEAGGLNDEQGAAVHHPAHRSLAVIAGAGSGKTRVLTCRAAWVVAQNGHQPNCVLAVTFTNKAANEIRTRLAAAGVNGSARMWAGTFHGLAHRFLRAHPEAVGLPPSFQIIDVADQEKLIKKLYAEHAWPVDEHTPKDAVRYISAQKDAGHTPLQADAGTPEAVFFKSVYGVYQATCDAMGLVDFGELLLRALRLFTDTPSVRLLYQQQFRHILVDEFQDTNDIQYALIDVLSDRGQAVPVTIVGDMDQSIYSWRGARMENVRRFITEFPDVATLKLETNYRSSPEILTAANALIGNNTHRIEKVLRPGRPSGLKPVLFEAKDERDEADAAVAAAIRRHQSGGAWADTAVIYRSNAMSRVVEESCLRRRVPYVIHGGLRFFDRAEIKDALAHLAVIAEPGNPVALERALSSPPKGLGAKFMDTALAAARAAQSWPDYLSSPSAGLAGKQKACWMLWSGMWTDRRQGDRRLDDQLAWCVESTGLLEHYRALDRKDGSDRAQNLLELISTARRFMPAAEHSTGLAAIQEFLSSVALEADTGRDGEEDRIKLMTIHAAKGLEFPVVCAIGWDEGVFPSPHACGDRARMEEERRLAYVAITRAESELLISGAVSRRQYGKMFFPEPSRFVSEIEHACVWKNKPTRRLSDFFEPPEPVAPASQPLLAESFWSPGDNVRHPVWGGGVVVRADGVSADARLQVQFSDGVRRILLPGPARLERGAPTDR